MIEPRVAEDLRKQLDVEGLGLSDEFIDERTKGTVFRFGAELREFGRLVRDTFIGVLDELAWGLKQWRGIFKRGRDE